MTKRTTTAVLILLAVVFMALGVWFANRAEQAGTEEMVPDRRGASPVDKAAEKDAAPLTGLSDRSTGRENADTRTPDAHEAVGQKNAPDVTTAVAQRIRGRVLDMQGAPVPGLDVTAREEGPQALARSGPDGSFELETVKPYLALVAESPEYATVRALAFRSEPIRDGLLVVAPVVGVSGSVVDATGIGIEGARVAEDLDDTAMVSFPLPLDTTMAPTMPETTSGAGGAFTLPRSLAVAHATLRASHEGFDAVELPAPTKSTSDLRFVLKPSAPSGRFITGVVVHADGSPATRASVHLGEAETKVDDRGAFRFRVPQWLRDQQMLIAVEAGSQAASLPDFGRRLNESKEAPAPVRLVLGPSPLAIAGHVFDDKHEPLSGWNVALLRPTPVSVGRVPPITAEALTTGSDGQITTDAAGAFRIEGLLDRPYELFAIDSTSLARIETPPVPAGKLDVEIVLPADTFVSNVTGHIVARDGTPVPGASVSIGLVLASDEGASFWINGTQTTADATGAFAFAKMPRRFVHIDVGGDMVLPKAFPVTDMDLAKPLRLEVDRRCHFKIEGLPTSPGFSISSAPGQSSGKPLRWIGAYDASGKELSIMMFQSGGWSSMNRPQVTTDTTRVYAVSETAVELRLYDQSDHVADKRPVHFVPGQVTVVTW